MTLTRRYLARALAALSLLLAAGCSPSRTPAPAGDTEPAPAAEIAYTKDGVLHARAARIEGAYFALGWATARDRAFQLELFRLSSEGRVAELLGNGALRRDGFIRTLGVPERSRALVEQIARQPFARRALEAYARGVNARLDSLRSGLLPLPRDLALAGVKPGRWTLASSMGVALLQGI